MQLRKIPFQPGVNKEGTEYTAGYGWYDSDKIRFRKGRPEKIGGWEDYSENLFYGIARAMHNYRSADSADYICLGTTQKMYVEEGGSYNDVTPIRSTTGAGDPTFAAVNGSTTITVTDTSHGAVIGDWVTFSSTTTLGGTITAAVLDQEYQITDVVDADSYTFTATATANASDTGNGGAGSVAAYQINIGLDAYVASVGYGYGTYGSGTWGGTPSFSVANQLRLWTMDNFGDDVIASVRGGGIYYWDESVGTGTRAVALPDLGGASQAPTKALQVMVSDQDRHVIAFGVNPIGSADLDPLFIRWSDKEDAADWNPSATNSAGGTRLSGGSVLIGALQTRQEILIWTDSTVHSMRYAGQPFIFNFNVVGEGVSLISPKAAAAAGDVVYFMDAGGFYIYNGTVNRLPCLVNDYVFDNLNYTQAYKVFAFTNHDFSEITWMYPTGDGTDEVSNYVTYNYAQNIWYIGTMSRGSWIPTITKENPIASTAVQDTFTAGNQLFSHELNYDDEDGSGITAYIESGDMEAEDGDSFLFVGTIVPDIEFDGTGGSVAVTLKGERYPTESTTTLDSGTVTQDTTNKLDVRARARSMKLRFESTGAGFGWRLGDTRMRMRTDGRR